MIFQVTRVRQPVGEAYQCVEIGGMRAGADALFHTAPSLEAALTEIRRRYNLATVSFTAQAAPGNPDSLYFLTPGQHIEFDADGRLIRPGDDPSLILPEGAGRDPEPEAAPTVRRTFLVEVISSGKASLPIGSAEDEAANLRDAYLDGLGFPLSLDNGSLVVNVRRLGVEQ